MLREKAAFFPIVPPFHDDVHLTYENELQFEFLFISEIQRFIGLCPTSKEQ